MLRYDDVKHDLFLNFYNKIMKRILLVFMALFVVLVFFSACARIGKDDLSSQNQPFGEMRRPDFGQPEREADFRGLVKSVLGNEVTILKFDSSEQRPNGLNSEDGVDNEGDFKNGSDSEESAAVAVSLTGAAGAIPTGGGGRPAGGMMPGGGPAAGGGRMMAGGAADSETRAQMLARLQEMSTGEEKIVIPVGIRMLKPDTAATNTNNGDRVAGRSREMIEATLSDITADKMITVWLNSEITDRKVAEFVLIN